MEERLMQYLRLLPVVFVFVLINSGSPVYANVDDWPDRHRFIPVTGAPVPNPSHEIEIGYKCKRNKICELSDFMERVDACAIFVQIKGKPVLHEKNSRNSDCNDSASKDQYGLASITKSIMAAMFGIALHSGEFGDPMDLQTSATAALQDLGLTYRDTTVTVENLLNMTSGMGWSESENAAIRITKDRHGNPSGPNKHKSLVEAAGWRMKSSPGPGQGKKDFRYSSFDSLLLGFLIENRLKVSGYRSLATAFDSFFWQGRLGGAPVMEQRAKWKLDFLSHPPGYCCLYMSPSDLARFGQWFLEAYKTGNGTIGDWAQKSVVNSVNMKEACRFRDQYEQSFRYGYQWRVLTKNSDSFFAYGSNGQFLHLFPREDSVVVQFSENKRVSKSELCESLYVHQLLIDSAIVQ